MPLCSYFLSFSRYASVRLIPLLLVSLVAFFCVNWTASAQSAQELQEEEKRQKYLVSKVRIRGNRIFTDDQIQSRIRTKANRRFLRIPGFTWWYWLYQLGDSGVFGNRVGNALKSTGEPPAYLDPIVLNQDIERLRILYQQAGYRNAGVSTSVDTTAQRRIEVTFAIDHGAPTHIRNVNFEISSLDGDQKAELIEGSLLKGKREISEEQLNFKAQNQLFSEALLHEERRRILDHLLEEGYAAIARDSVRAIITTVSSDSFDVKFLVNPGPRFRVDKIAFHVTGPEDLSIVKRDTLENKGSRDGSITSVITGDRRIKTDIIANSLQFSPGEWYNREKLLASKRALEGTGIFVFTRIEPMWNEVTYSDSSTVPELPFKIDLQTRERHQMQFETIMLQRSGVLAASENELGMGLGVTYENANLLGNGEQFRLTTTGSVAGDIDSTFFRSAEAEIATSLTLPYITAPFKSLENIFDLYNARTQLSLSFLTARREELRFVIRGRGTARFRLEMQHNPTVVSYVDLLDLSLSNPDTLRGFGADSLGQLLGSIEDPIQQAQVLDDYTQPQINSSLRYTLRSSNVNPLRREQGYSYEGALEIGGNMLPYLLDRYVHTPDTLEGRIPGISLFTGSGSRNDLIYRQYVRVSGDVRRYKPVGPNTVFAWKFITGVAHPTGKADTVPFDRRFYSGGASSVRGWGLRELGPGKIKPDTTSNRFSGELSSIFGGDIKLEASLELRNTMLRNVFAADWILTFFGDAGNVWFGPRNPGNSDGRFRFDSFYREIGVSGGFGLRFAWEYLILRLDLAYRIYDPSLDGEFVNNAFRGPKLHFGIGHAF